MVAMVLLKVQAHLLFQVGLMNARKGLDNDSYTAEMAWF
jgi:hypothetical protein